MSTPSRRSLAAAVLALMLLAGAVSWLLSNASPTPPFADLAGTGNNIASASPEDAANIDVPRIHGDYVQPRDKTHTRQLLIVDASTNRPVTGCSILPLNSQLVCSSKEALESSRIAVSDALGLCSFDADGRVCVCHAGYQAQIVGHPHDQDPPPQVVRLHPGLGVKIECRFGDRAVAGINLALSAVGLRGVDLRQPGLHDAIALEATRGIHFAQTDERGIATFSELGDTTYCAFCLSPDYCITTDMGPGGPLIVRPPGYVQVDIAGVAIVRASLANGTTCVLHGMSLPRTGFDRHGTLSKVALAYFPELRQELWQVRAVSHDSPQQGETLRILTSRGTWSTTRLNYQPLLSSRAQVLADIDQVPKATNDITIEARDARKRLVPIPLRIAEITSPPGLAATATLVSGSTISLPNGKYAVWAHDCARQWFRKVEFNVPEDDSHVVLASAECLSGLSVQVQPQSGIAITDWICSIRHAKQRPFQYPVQGHDTAHFWLPEGEVELRVSSPGMAQVNTTVSLYDTTTAAPPRTITIAMKEQDGVR